MPIIIVELPQNREQCGTLGLKDDNGDIIAGRFPALGKADAETAENFYNRFRNPVRLYGDTPLGDYKVIGICLKDSNIYYQNEKSYGPNGVVILEPLTGDAAVAKANGRTSILIQGGELGSNGGLRPTNGGIRLSDYNMAILINVLKKIRTSLICRCVEVNNSRAIANPVAPDNGYYEGDPSPIGLTYVSGNNTYDTYEETDDDEDKEIYQEADIDLGSDEINYEPDNSLDSDEFNYQPDIDLGSDKDEYSLY